MSILVVSNAEDTTCDLVIAELTKRSRNYVRLNTEDFLSWRWTWTKFGWELRSDQAVLLRDEVTAVYYRRPKQPNPRSGTSPDVALFVIREALAALNEALASLKVPWISNRESLDRAENKLYQLRVAQKLGFNVPDTVVTNDKHVFEAFRQGKDVIVKPLFGGYLSENPARIAYTSRIKSDEAYVASEIEVCPHLLQREVPKLSDIRVTVVDDQLFACRIHSQNHAQAVVDFRAAMNSGVRLRHELMHLPDHLSLLCFSLVKWLGLRFGAIDIVEAEDGFHFLEINPNGQWGWIEDLTGAPIASAIADALCKQ